jgi:hypothetical protein
LITGMWTSGKVLAAVRPLAAYAASPGLAEQAGRAYKPQLDRSAPPLSKE